jgi:hypothetical protein
MWLSMSAASKLCAAPIAWKSPVKWHDLCIAAPGCATFHAETRPEAGLTKANERVLADLVHAITEANRRGRLPFASRRRRHGGNQDQLARLLIGAGFDEIRGNLGFIVTKRDQRIIGDAQPFSDLINGLESCRLGNFDIAFDCHGRDSFVLENWWTRILAEFAPGGAWLVQRLGEIRISPTASRSCRSDRPILKTCRKFDKKSTH